LSDQPDINAALLGADQRFYDAGAGSEAVAPTRISRSALSIARTANAAQSSSGAKKTAITSFDVTEAAGSACGVMAKASDRAIER